jgi:hypothetical protein
MNGDLVAKVIKNGINPDVSQTWETVLFQWKETKQIIFIWSLSFAVIKQHHVTEFITVWSSACTPMKLEQCSRRVFKETRRRETKQNLRATTPPSSDFPFLPHSSLPVPPAPFYLYQVYLWGTIFIFACGDKFFLPGDLLVFLSSEISLDAPLPSLVPLLLGRTWNLVTLHGRTLQPRIIPWRLREHVEVNLHTFLVKVIWDVTPCHLVIGCQYFRGTYCMYFWTFSIVRYSREQKHDVSETASVSVLRWSGEKTPTQLGPLERANLNHWTTQSDLHSTHMPETRIEKEAEICVIPVPRMRVLYRNFYCIFSCYLPPN